MSKELTTHNFSDIDIAQNATMEHIRDIASKLGVSDEDIEMYGKYKAKLPLTLIDEDNVAKNKLSQIKHPSIGIDHDGGWEVVSLYSESGEAESVAKNLNTKTSPTEIIKYFSYTNTVIKNLLTKYECEPRRIRFSTLKAKKFTHNPSGHPSSELYLTK